MDMRNITYDDMDTTGLISNTLSFTENIPGDFDMATDQHKSEVTAGRYIYIPGDGNLESAGTYEYFDGDFFIDDIDWESFRHEEQNITITP